VKIPVTERALKLRLRQALQTQGKHLRIITRQEQRKFGLGRFYLVSNESVIDTGVTLALIGRTLL
jgi:hypothetical protein